MNRPVIRHTLILAACFASALAAEAGLLLAGAPVWAVFVPLAALLGALWAAGRAYPPYPTMAEMIAARDARYGLGGGTSGAADPAGLVLIGDLALPPPVPGMITAPYPGHDHGSPGPCRACMTTIALLATLGGAEVEIPGYGAGERKARPGDVVAAYMAAQDADARAYTAAGRQAAADLLASLRRGPFTEAPMCGAARGPHLCPIRGSHACHVCSCGKIWGFGNV